MQKQQLHSELKKEFQLERLILFSDAVFAIAITLHPHNHAHPALASQEVCEEGDER